MKSSGHPIEGRAPVPIQPAPLATALSGYASQGHPGAASLRPEGRATLGEWRVRKGRWQVDEATGSDGAFD